MVFGISNRLLWGCLFDMWVFFGCFHSLIFSVSIGIRGDGCSDKLMDRSCQDLFSLFFLMLLFIVNWQWPNLHKQVGAFWFLSKATWTMWLWVSQMMCYRFPSKSRQSSRQRELRHKAQLAPVCSLRVLFYEMKIFSESVLLDGRRAHMWASGGDAGDECAAIPCELVHLLNELVLGGMLWKANKDTGPQVWRRKGCLWYLECFEPAQWWSKERICLQSQVFVQ